MPESLPLGTLSKRSWNQADDDDDDDDDHQPFHIQISHISIQSQCPPTQDSIEYLPESRN